jgi:protein TonB
MTTTPPEAATRTPYDYPQRARDAKVDGTVVVSVLVCEHGRVRQTRIIQSVPMLDAEAEACVREWTFRAAINNGTAVPCWVNVPIRFTLP